MRSHLTIFGLTLVLVISGCAALTPSGEEMEETVSPSQSQTSVSTPSPSPSVTVLCTKHPDTTGKPFSESGVPIFIESDHNPSHTATVLITKLQTGNTTTPPPRFNQTVQVDSSVRSVLRTDGTVFTEGGDYRVTLGFRTVDRSVETTLTVGDNLTLAGWRWHALVEITILPTGYEKPQFEVDIGVWFRDRPPRSEARC